MRKTLRNGLSQVSRDNRYWHRFRGSGAICDNCGGWTNFFGCMVNRKTKRRLCIECYKKGIK